MQKIALMTLISATLATLVGCASMPTPQYTSPNNYQSYDCGQMMSEYNRLTQYINANQHQGGLTMSGVGIGLGIGRGGIYPTINMGVGSVNGGNRNNLAIAMGERDALVQAGRMKQCGFVNGVKLFTEK